MSTPFLGDGAAVGFGAEVTRNSAVSRTHWFRLISHSGGRVVETSPRASLAAGTGNALPSDVFKKSDRVKGSLVLECTYEGMGLILKHLFHKAPTTLGAGPFTHTQLLGRDYDLSLTMELIYGTGSAEVFAGVVFSKGTFDIRPGEPVRLTLEYFGYTSGGRVAAGTPSYTANELYWNGAEGATITWNGLTPDVRSMRWIVDHKLAERAVVGSYHGGAPMPSGNRTEVAIEVDADYASDDLYDAYLANSRADIEMTFTLDARSVAFTAHNAYLDTNSIDVSTVGVLPEKIRFLALTTGTDGLSVVTVNTQASAVAA